MVHDLTFTAAGIETITATHVVGPWRLTELLIAQRKLDLNRDARVIFVSSGGMYTQPLLLERLNQFKDGYDGVKHYALTKRAQVSLAEAFTERYANTQLIAVAMHPGWVDTPALRRAMPTFWRLTQSILRTPDQGADTIVWLSTVESQYFNDKDIFFLTARRWMSICQGGQGRCHSPTTHSWALSGVVIWSASVSGIASGCFVAQSRRIYRCLSVSCTWKKICLGPRQRRFHRGEKLRRYVSKK